MNTLWLKIASGVIGILILIVLVSMFMPGGDNETEPPTTNRTPDKEDSTNKSYRDQVREDKDYLSVNDEDVPDNPEDYTPPAEEPPHTGNTDSPTPQEAPPLPVTPQPTEVTIYVKVLSDSEKLEAEKQLNYAIDMFGVGRLPTTSFKQAIDPARRILDRWPDSIYAFKAKLLLAKVPERYQQRFRVTSAEMDTSMFLTSKAGTVPVTVKIEDR
jgi:hypothetical protein